MNKVRQIYQPFPNNKNPKDPVTAADLEIFKKELLDAIKKLIEQKSQAQKKYWLKSYEVMKMLGLSPGTLQTLRNNGTLPFSKLGGVIYYDIDVINQILEGKKQISK